MVPEDGPIIQTIHIKSHEHLLTSWFLFYFLLFSLFLIHFLSSFSLFSSLIDLCSFSICIFFFLTPHLIPPSMKTIGQDKHNSNSIYYSQLTKPGLKKKFNALIRLKQHEKNLRTKSDSKGIKQVMIPIRMLDTMPKKANQICISSQNLNKWKVHMQMINGNKKISYKSLVSDPICSLVSFSTNMRQKNSWKDSNQRWISFIQGERDSQFFDRCWIQFKTTIESPWIHTFLASMWVTRYLRPSHTPIISA